MGKNQMKEAMTRTGLNACYDNMSNHMKAALTENRVGARAKMVKGDQQVQAMSNQFELAQTQANDAMTAAMTECRVALMPKKSPDK